MGVNTLDGLSLRRHLLLWHEGRLLLLLLLRLSSVLSALVEADVVVGLL